MSVFTSSSVWTILVVGLASLFISFQHEASKICQPQAQYGILMDAGVSLSLSLLLHHHLFLSPLCTLLFFKCGICVWWLGSSATRAHIYKWDKCSPLTTLSRLTSTSAASLSLGEVNIAEDVVQVVFKFAKTVIPEESWHETNVIVSATAGLISSLSSLS